MSSSNRERRLTMAYADPPYIGQSKKHYGDHEDYAGEVDHGELVERLQRDYPDGWAISLSSPSTHIVLDHCRDHGLDLMAGDIRLMAWVKPFAAFKRNVRVAYTWEPVIVKPAERLDGAIPTRDFCAEPITKAAAELGISENSVKTHLRGVATALNTSSRFRWALFAIGIGLLEDE